MKTGLLLSIFALLVYENIYVIASKRSHKTAEDLIEDICDKLFDEDLPFEENQRWERLCQNWMKSKHHSVDQDKNIIDEMSMTQNHQPRLIGSRGSRGGSSRRTTGGGGSGGSGGGGSRPTSPGIRYRIRSTGANIIRPPGSLWSRTRGSFLPISRRYFYSTRSSTNRYTTPSTGSTTYYYCSTNDTIPDEIQCSSINDDTNCCEDETNREVVCCSEKIGDDLDDDYNRATKLLAKTFYTLAAMALLLHILRRRFNQ